MKKPMKIFLGIAGTLALLGICIACLAVYAKKEINTPKFEMPKAETVEPIAPLPDSKEAAFDYVNSLYNACISADDIELSRHTDVHLTNGERVTPFSDADNEVFARALENAQGAISALCTIVPLITSALGIIPKFLWPINKKTRERMYYELSERRKKSVDDYMNSVDNEDNSEAEPALAEQKV